MRLFLALFLSTVALQAWAAPQFDKHLLCTNDAAEAIAANPPDKLEVFLDLNDGLNSTFNGAQPQAAVDPFMAGSLGMAQIVELDRQQFSITTNFLKIYVKDVTSYSCTIVP